MLVARPRRKGRLPEISLLFLLTIFLSHVHLARSQFGEIASVITGLLGSGGGAGLAGLAGTGAGLAGTGAAAGSGAAGALGSIGPLYQLAQAALQLTGTGVGIANQASESAWFPVAVENAAKMNRDFQDRLLRGGPLGVSPNPRSGLAGMLGGLGGLPGLGGLGGSGTATKLGTEYGKNFESGEAVDYETEGPLHSSTLAPPPSTSQPPFAPSPQRRPLPGLVSLLPGESSARTEEELGPSISVDRPSPSPSSSSEIDSQGSAHSNRGVAALISSSERSNKGSLGASEERMSPSSANAGSESNKPASKPEIEFSTDPVDEEDESPTPLFPPRASLPRPSASAASIASALEGIDESDLPQMVPELKKLITSLKTSNLSREDFDEISDQLEGNKDLVQPRENTAPPTTDSTTQPSAEQEGRIPNEKRDRAANRNLAALRGALSDVILRKVQSRQQEAPVVISLRRPNTNQFHIVHRGSADVSTESSTPTTETPLARARLHAATPYPRRVMAESKKTRRSDQAHRQAGQVVQKGIRSSEEEHTPPSASTPTQGARTQVDDATSGEKRPIEEKAKEQQVERVPTNVAAGVTTAPIIPQQQAVQAPPSQQVQLQNQWPASYNPYQNYYNTNNNNQQQPVYYPQYGGYYYPQQQQQQPYANQYYTGQQYYYQTTPRTQPARTIPEPLPTTPPSLV